MTLNPIPNFTVNITDVWSFVRSVVLWAWGVLSADVVRFGTINFSPADILLGFTLLGIFLRLVFARMHLGTALSASRARERSEKRGSKKSDGKQAKGGK